MSRARRLWLLLSNLLLGSAVATRAGGGVPADHDPNEAAMSSRWDTVRREAQEAVALEGLPPEVRQFLPGHGPYDLDIATAIRLSYAAAERRHFPILHRYWLDHPGVQVDEDAQQALAETQRWLGSEDGMAALLFPAGARTPAPLTDDLAFEPDIQYWEARRGNNNPNSNRGRGDDDDDGGYDDD